MCVPGVMIAEVWSRSLQRRRRLFACVGGGVLLTHGLCQDAFPATTADPERCSDGPIRNLRRHPLRRLLKMRRDGDHPPGPRRQARPSWGGNIVCSDIWCLPRAAILAATQARRCRSGRRAAASISLTHHSGTRLWAGRGHVVAKRTETRKHLESHSCWWADQG